MINSVIWKFNIGKNNNDPKTTYLPKLPGPPIKIPDKEKIIIKNMWFFFKLKLFNNSLLLKLYIKPKITTVAGIKELTNEWKVR